MRSGGQSHTSATLGTGASRGWEPDIIKVPSSSQRGTAHQKQPPAVIAVGPACQPAMDRAAREACFVPVQEPLRDLVVAWALFHRGWIYVTVVLFIQLGWAKARRRAWNAMHGMQCDGVFCVRRRSRFRRRTGLLDLFGSVPIRPRLFLSASPVVRRLRFARGALVGNVISWKGIP